MNAESVLASPRWSLSDSMQIIIIRVISTHAPIANLFHLHRKHLTAAHYRGVRATDMAAWREVTLSTAI